jgi:predicted nucleic acid-binding protein
MMNPRIKIYLDTSVISALFDDRNPDRRQLTEDFFSTIDTFDPYISSITVAEIDNTPDEELKENMRERVKKLAVLKTSSEIDVLAQQYIRDEAIPKRFQEDAYHIAFAVIH